MKTLPAGLAAHVALGTTSLAWLLKVTRTDAEVYAFTSAAADLTVDGVLYLSAPGLDISSIAANAGLAVDNLELTTLDDGSTFTRADVLSGRWRNASYVISRCNHRNVADGVEPMQAGTIGDVRLHNGYIVAELRGLQQYLQQPIGAVTSKTCRARLGDALCTVDLAPHTYSGTITTAVDNQTFADSALGGDEYYDDVILLLHGDGSHGSTTFTDNSSLAATISIYTGTPSISTAQSKFGGASIAYPSNASIKPPTDPAYAMSGDLCVEAWVRTTSTGTQYPITLGSNVNAANGGGIIFYTGTIQLYLNAATRITGPAFSIDTWYHVAITRSGSTWRLFVDGVSYGTYSSAANFDQGLIYVGGRQDGANPFLGYLDDVRVTKGQARYTANFTPPIEAAGNNAFAHADDWFTEGVCTFTSGANTGLSQKIKSSLSTGAFTLSLPMILTLAAGDTFDAVRGCRKRREDCVAFSNILNMQAEPDCTGIDALTRPA